MAQVAAPAVTNGQKGHLWKRVKEEAAPGKETGAAPGAGLTQPASPPAQGTGQQLCGGRRRSAQQQKLKGSNRWMTVPSWTQFKRRRRRKRRRIRRRRHLWRRVMGARPQQRAIKGGTLAKGPHHGRFPQSARDPRKNPCQEPRSHAEAAGCWCEGHSVFLVLCEDRQGCDGNHEPAAMVQEAGGVLHYNRQDRGPNQSLALPEEGV